MILSRTYKGKRQYAYSVYYHDIMGNLKRKHSKWYDSKKTATTEEATFLLRNNRSEVRVNFYDVALDWVKSSQNTPKTIKEKTRIIDIHFKPFKHKMVQDITLPMVRQLFEDKKIQSYSTKYKNKIRSYLNCIFKHAKLYYGLDSNPVELFPTFKKTDEEKLHTFDVYTSDEFSRFENEIEKEEVKAFYHVLFWTGMRFNECNSLTFSCVKGNVINVYRQYDKGWRTLKTKGSKRKIPIDKDTLNEINIMRLKWSEYPSFSDDWFIFGGPRQLPEKTINRYKKKAAQKAGLKEIRNHDFRHSHASYLIEKGVNIYKISKRLGHSGIAITLDRYGHLLDTDGDEILRAIEDKN